MIAAVDRVGGGRTRAYKFLRQRDLASFLSGTVRVGTAREYGIPDGNDGGRADPLEGIATHAPPTGPVKASDIPELFGPFFRIKDVSTWDNLTLQFGPESKLIWEHNFFMFCASAKLTHLMVDRMFVLFDYDCCVTIFDFELFARRVNEADERLWKSAVPNMKDHEILCKAVIYGEKQDTTTYNMIDPFLKPPAFRWQKELRATFPGFPREPLLVKVPAVVPLLRETDLTSFRRAPGVR